MAEQLPTPENNDYDDNLAAEEQELASGNNRLALIVGGLLLLLIVGYVLLPKGNGSGLASVTPTFLLDDAAVTGTTPTAADSIAAGLKSAAVASAEPATPSVRKPATATASMVAAAPAATPAEAPIAPAAAEASPAAAPEPAAAPAAAPAAPSTVSLTGRISDENGRPLIGATVFLKGSGKATSTDANGNYSIEVPAGTDNTLTYGYGGYEDEVVKSHGSQPVNVALTPSPNSGKKRRR